MVLNHTPWDRYRLGKRLKLKDPTNGSLDKLMTRGAVVMACNLALGFFSRTVIAKVDKVDNEEAKRRATAALVPGVILQPSDLRGGAGGRGWLPLHPGELRALSPPPRFTTRCAASLPPRSDRLERSGPCR